jgi:threonine aldolase
MFLRLLEDDLYLKHARHANYCAEQLIKGLDLLAVPHLPPNHTNQIFLTLSNETIARLSEDYKFDIWSPGKKESMIRLVTSWATDIKMCEEFILDLKKILNK